MQVKPARQLHRPTAICCPAARARARLDPEAKFTVVYTSAQHPSISQQGHVPHSHPSSLTRQCSHETTAIRLAQSTAWNLRGYNHIGFVKLSGGTLMVTKHRDRPHNTQNTHIGSQYLPGCDQLWPAEGLPCS